LGRDHLVRGPLDGVERFGGAQSVGAHVARFAFDLLFDAGDANLEKFVQVRAENRQEFDALNERLRRVLCFLEHAPVEFEPAQLAINEIFRSGKTGRRGGLLRRIGKGDDIRRLFRRRSFRSRTHRSQPAAS